MMSRLAWSILAKYFSYAPPHVDTSGGRAESWPACIVGAAQAGGDPDKLIVNIDDAISQFADIICANYYHLLNEKMLLIDMSPFKGKDFPKETLESLEDLAKSIISACEANGSLFLPSILPPYGLKEPFRHFGRIQVEELKERYPDDTDF